MDESVDKSHGCNLFVLFSPQTHNGLEKSGSILTAVPCNANGYDSFVFVSGAVVDSQRFR